MKEIQRARHEESSKRSTRFMASSFPPLFIATKCNAPEEPILIDKDYEEPLTLTPLSIYDPNTNKQPQLET